MDDKYFFQIIVSALLGSGCVVGLLFLFIRNWVEKRLNKQDEKLIMEKLKIDKIMMDPVYKIKNDYGFFNFFVKV